MFILPTIHLSLERWKFNKEYGIWVSNFGNFKDKHKRPIPVKVCSSNGYLRVKTKYGNKSAHRIVMYTWCPIEDREAFTVDHLDHNKRNNRVDNLEWVTQQENLIRAGDDVVNAPAPVQEFASVDCPHLAPEDTLTAWLAKSTDSTVKKFIRDNKITLSTIFVNDKGFRGTYLEARQWMANNKILSGKSDDKFFLRLCNACRDRKAKNGTYANTRWWFEATISS